MVNLNYREKSLYGELLLLVIIFGSYFSYVGENVVDVGRLAIAVVLLVIAEIVFHSILAAASKKRLVDERDREIEARGYKAGYVMVTIYIWVAVGLVLLHGTFSTVLVMNILIAGSVLAGIAKTVTQLVSYRMAV